MRVIKQLVLFVFIAIGISSCSNNSIKTTELESSNPQHIEKHKEIIRQTLIDMLDAIEKEDIDRYASYVHPDFTQFEETDSFLRIGKNAEIKGVENWISNSEGIHTEMNDPRITIKDDVAWITYYWRDHGTTNGASFSSNGKSTRIFVLENGKWLCIHGHFTLLPDLQE